jgi:hypothetical protein
LLATNGTEVGTITAFDTPPPGGVRVATGDVNGDGSSDTIVGTGPGVPTRVRVFDGKTKDLIFEVAPFEASFLGGVFVASGDLDGDGLWEVIVTPDEGGGPVVAVYDGQSIADGKTGDAAQMARFFGIEDPDFRGGARAASADVTGDGLMDLLVAAGFGGGPRLAVFNGTSIPTGTPTKPFGDFFVFEQTLRNGVFVAGGDLDGDGFGDVIAGGGPGGGPRVFVLSGDDLVNAGGRQQVLANFFAGDTANRGGVRVGVKNLDGDERADLVVGAGAEAGNRVTTYAGTAINPGSTPAESFALDAFPGFSGGVFVG